MAKTPKFLNACHLAAEIIGRDIDENLTWAVESKKTSTAEDDGILHVEKRGLHVCFDIGQDRPLKEQNERMTKVLTYLGLMKFADKCLHSKADVEAEEAEERGECCECGRSCGCR